MASAKTKILIVEPFQANIELIVKELDKGFLNHHIEIAGTKNDFKKNCCSMSQILYYQTIFSLLLMACRCC